MKEQETLVIEGDPEHELEWARRSTRTTKKNNENFSFLSSPSPFWFSPPFHFNVGRVTPIENDDDSYGEAPGLLLSPLNFKSKLSSWCKKKKGWRNRNIGSYPNIIALSINDWNRSKEYFLRHTQILWLYKFLSFCLHSPVWDWSDI